MPDFTAKDVQEVRAATGAGMMDSKKALTETLGDKEAAKRLLREKGLAAASTRSDRENAQGSVSIFVDGHQAAMVQLKCETDFVAKSEHFRTLGSELAALVALKGEDAVASKSTAIDDLKVTLKENIEIGQVVRFEAPEGNVIDSYLHVQSDRGVNGVLVQLQGGTQQLAHDIAVHIAFARPKYLTRDEVPADVVAAERATLETISRNEGKPEAALPKIIEGRLTGFFKDIVLLDQPFAKDDKVSIAQLLGGATIVRYAQVEIGS